VNVRVARLPSSTLSLRFGRVIWAVLLRAFMSTRSGRSFVRGSTRENEPIFKKWYVVTRGWICEHSCSSFPQLSLVPSFRSCRSGGSFEGVPTETPKFCSGRAPMETPDFVRAGQNVSCVDAHANRRVRSFEGVRVNFFEWVVQGRTCQLVQAGPSGEGALRQTSPY